VSSRGACTYRQQHLSCYLLNSRSALSLAHPMHCPSQAPHLSTALNKLKMPSRADLRVASTDIPLALQGINITTTICLISRWMHFAAHTQGLQLQTHDTQEHKPMHTLQHCPPAKLSYPWLTHTGVHHTSKHQHTWGLFATFTQLC